MHLKDVSIQRSRDRGAFVYESGTISMKNVDIKDTKSHDTPAVQAGGTATLKMTRCRVRRNAGPGIVIAAGVSHELKDTVTDDGGPVFWDGKLRCA